jgi:hypothetical protein
MDDPRNPSLNSFSFLQIAARHHFPMEPQREKPFDVHSPSTWPLRLVTSGMIRPAFVQSAHDLLRQPGENLAGVP